MNEAQQLSERKRPSIILKQKEQLWNFHQPNETSTAEKQRQLEYYFNIQDLQPQKKKYINKTISGIRSRQNNEQLLQGDDKMINVKSYLKYKIETKNTLKKEIYNEEQYKQNNEKQNSLTVDVDQLINNGINLIDFNKSQLKRPQTQDKKLSQQQNQKYITTIFNKKRKIKSSEATLKLQRMINQTLFIKKNMTQGKRVKIKTNSFMGMVNLN
ncbi:hypothetical protein PPERSA_08588 [Pseudocohnilembus persalinus]|uniref:Uncharacterized protein n=1 Tax=Pseudocohnilembus persalinus TaxID=266149 RepID=A0A0V0R2H2_PSEPJ|nr:hypothetical protein PPERSA_08588 [Pseudocohnilembus persalinus]|eukprot:KRX08389.1 hypothetical protein PPERSA_08588 [Pseudocohnilembus persalinus]